MSSPLEIKRIQLELARVSTARMDLDYRVHERLEEIARLKEHILIQENKEKELQEQLKKLGL